MRRSRRRRSQPTQVGEMVGGVLGDLGLEGAARAFQIAERWEEALGPEIARHSQPVALRDGTLEVWVTSSVWCQQLQLQTPELLAALSAVLSDAAPTALRFRLGYAGSRVPGAPSVGSRDQ